jgi:hypothetical protein
MIILNFSHPLTDQHLQSISDLTHQEIEQVITIPVQFDPQWPFEEQLEALTQSIPFTPEQLQTIPIIVNLPSLNHIAALLLAYLHGIMGHFPAILRMRPVTGSTPPAFEVAEIINLQSIRDKSRISRTET